MTRALTSLTVLSLLALTAPAAAQTTVPAGNLVGSQTWTTAGSPYLLSGDVTVPTGVNLTIQPGVEVRLGPGDSLGSGLDTVRTELRVSGTLAIQGTSASRVTITSGAASRAVSDHYGVVLLAGGSANVAHATIEYGHRCLHDLSVGAVITGLVTNACNYGVMVEGGTPTITASTIQASTSYGLYALSSANVTASGLVIAGNTSYGLYAVDSDLTLTGSIIRGNGSRGVYLRSNSGTRNTSLVHNTIHGNGTYGLYILENAGTLNTTVRDNLILGNGSYGIYVSGLPSLTISYNLVWDHTSDYSGASAGSGSLSENPLVVSTAAADFRPTSRSPLRLAASDGTDIGALAYDGVATTNLVGHLYSNTVLTAAASPHVVTGDLTVRAGVTLTIEPGAVVRFAAGTDEMRAGADTARTELRVLGTLIADGTASTGIELRASGASPAPGDWYGVILLPSSAASVIDYATIRHAVYGVRSSAPGGTVVQRSTIESSSSYGVYVDGGAATFSELLIRNNASYGFYAVDASPTLTGSRIWDNSSRGVYLRTNSGTHTMVVTGNTIVGNGTYGIYILENAGTLNTTVRDNVIVGNGSYGVYVSGLPSVTISHNLVWDHTTDYSGVSAGTGAITENPLFVDRNGRDLRLTANSPARRHSSTGNDIGALAFDGAPTIGVQGHLYTDTTWTAAGGPIDVLGDVTIEPGVTLTIGPGTIVRFAASADSMRANTDTALSELIVLGRLVVDGDPQARVTLGTSGTAARGNWYGVHLTATAGTSSVEHAVIEWARYGIRSFAPSTAVVSSTEVRESSSYGVYVEGGAITLDGLTVHDNGSYGLYAVDSDPTITNALIYSNTSRGLYARSNSGTHTVTANHLTIWGNGTYGVYVLENAGTLNFSLRNSIVSENGSYGLYVSGLPSMTLGYNDVWGHTTDYSGVSAGAGSISANPQFVDTSLRNFHLLPNSPAIDAGDTATASNHDLEGAVRPLDGNLNNVPLPDLGVYEYNASGNRWPIADAGPDRVVTSGVQATFSASGSYDPDGTIATYLWDFGDGTPTASGVSVTHTFTGGTDRTVTLTVTDNAGAIDVDTVNVEVNLAPVADAGADRYADPGEVVTFSGTSSTDTDGTIATYAWSFGDGAVATGPSVTHQYTAGGDYTVTLTVTDDDGATHSDTTVAHITGASSTPPSITHTPIANGQASGAAVLVQATVTGQPALASVTLYHRVQGGGTFVALPMTTPGGGVYSAQIPGNSVLAPAVEYYLEAVDTAVPARRTTSPASMGAVHAFTVVVTDATPPVITHTPIANGQQASTAVVITANVTDATGVASATLYHRATGTGAFASLPMSAIGGGNYSATIPAGAVTVAGVEYYVSATDSAMPANTATSPAGAPAVTHAFTVVAPVTVSPGDLVVTEIMFDPSGTETQREWFEIYNTTSAPIDLVGFTFSDDGTDSFTVARATPVVIAPGAYFVLGRNGDPALNGGVTVGYVYSGFALANSGDEIIISIGGVTIDRVAYDAAFPHVPGQAIALDPDNVDATANDDGASWCNGASVLASGDRGTPGAANDPCQVPADTTPPAIVHTPITNGQQSGVAVAVTAQVTDTSGLASVELYHRRRGAGAYTATVMTSIGGDVWQAQIPAASVTTAGVEYYLRALDGASPANEALSPSAGATGPHTFDVTATDTSGPAINHTRVADGQSAGSDVVVAATITDPAGVQGATLSYRTSGGAWQSVAMTAGASNAWSATIPGASVVPPSVEYFVESDDALGNGSSLPAAGQGAPFAFTVVELDTTGPVVTHTPVTGERPAGSAVVISARIVDPSGIADATLYYRLGGGTTFEAVTMSEGAPGEYSAEIPASAVVSGGIDYYLEASDESPAQNVARAPEGAPASTYGFTIGGGGPGDVAGPTILHLPIEDGQPQGAAVEVVAEVVDPSGVASVVLSYRKAGDDTFVDVPMTRDGATDTFTATIPGSAAQPGTIEYFVAATDGAPASNRATRPATAPAELFSFTVDAREPSPLDPRDSGGCACTAEPTHDGDARTTLVLLALALGLVTTRRR
ncbi:right-handed parallel beta-helix repeat-containing protein [Myxococcota bacterium]|nr:right-handed parallel beta-helix repeat-containing protein [Myxococcota bacterium]